MVEREHRGMITSKSLMVTSKLTNFGKQGQSSSNIVFCGCQFCLTPAWSLPVLFNIGVNRYYMLPQNTMFFGVKLHGVGNGTIRKKNVFNGIY